jgi:hypothetical protein
MRNRFLAAENRSPEVPMKKWWVFPFLAVLLLSCSADVPKEIVGYWEGEVIAQDLKFTADGRVEIVETSSMNPSSTPSGSRATS